MSIRPIASTYPTVGFFGRSSRSRPHNKQHKKKRGQVIPAADSTAIPDSETLLEFDSGRRMTFAQGTRSTLVIGGTGSGKTASVVLPMAGNLIRAGFGGLILDVKGNLREQVRALAASHGRLDDIVEFGSAPNANRCNFLAGMAEHEIADLMNVFAVNGVENDHNIAWHQKGLYSKRVSIRAALTKMPFGTRRSCNDGGHYARTCLTVS